MTDPRLEKLLLLEAKKRKASQSRSIDLLATSFPKQTAFIKDPAKLKVAFCTRRAGKSYGIGLYLIQEALAVPRCSVLYLALTKKTARQTMVKDILDPILKINEIPFKFNKTDGSYTLLNNGSIIYLAGADAKEDEMEKILGQKYLLAAIDECASFNQDLNRLVDKLRPGVSDYDGTIVLIGTPSNYTDNYFYELTKNDAEPSAFSVHRWTWKDNPHHLANRTKTHDQYVKTNPLVVLTNSYKQEWLGEWAIDESALCYQYTKDNVLPEPKIFKGFYYVLACDLGWEDDTAFAVWGYSYADPCAYIVHSEKKKHMDFTAVAKRAKELNEHYHFVKYIADGAGKQGVEEMKARHQIPWQATPKAPNYKFEAIKLMTSDLKAQRIKVCPGNQALLKEWDRLVWDENNPTKEKASKDNHLADAALYGFIACKHYMGSVANRPQEEVPQEPKRYSTIHIEEGPLDWLDR